MTKCKCGKEIKGNFPLCYECNQKKKETDFQKATEYKPEPESERMRLMILSYGKDLVVGHILLMKELPDFLIEAERYVKIGQYGGNTQ